MKNKRKNRPTAAAVLKAVSTIRRNNLRDLIGEGKRFATQVDLAIALGHTASYLCQLIGPKSIRKVTETTARKFEYKLGIPAGELDRV